MLLKGLRIKGWPEREKPEPAPQSIVDHRQRSICRIHQTNDVDVLGNAKRILGRLRIGERHCEALTPFVRLKEHHQLTKDFAHVAPVNLIDDKHPWALTQIALRLSAELIKNTVL